MQQILHINSSIHGQDTASYQLGQKLSQQLSGAHAAAIRFRNLGKSEIPHLDALTHQAFATPEEQLSDEQRQRLLLSDTLIAELQASDIIVMGVPLYNFGVPSELKAWFDHIARAGKTFSYTSNGPQGLLKNKKVYIIATRGGQYAGTAADTQSQYLEQVLAFVGLTDVEFIYVEGLASAENRAQVLSAAHHHIESLIAA